MEGTYFEALPKELLYKLSSCLNYDSVVYQVIKLFDLDYHTVFRSLLIKVHPCLSKYTLYEEFRGRRILWPDMYDYVRGYGITSESLVELLYEYQNINFLILLLKEYASADLSEVIVKNDTLLIYEHVIRKRSSSTWNNKISLSSLHLYMDIIIQSSSNFYVRTSHYIEYKTNGHINHELKLLSKSRDHIYLQVSTNYIVNYDASTKTFDVVGIMDNGKIRYMTKIEKIVAEALGYTIIFQPRLNSINSSITS